MRTKTLLVVSLSIGLTLGAAAMLQGQAQRQTPSNTGNSALEALELVRAQAFVLDEPFVHYWRKERPQFQGGQLLVLKASPEFLRPRQGLEPVLYVGAETAERLNNPERSGYLICLVPSGIGMDLSVDLDLAQAPIWFGTPELPERVDSARAQLELKRALSLGIKPKEPTQQTDKAALGQGKQLVNTTIYMKNRTELDLVIADLLEQYSPTEVDLIAGLRLPLSR